MTKFKETNALERFESKIEKTESCWIWKAKFFPTGYGVFWLKKNIAAHRASWILFKGDIQKGFCVCHSCDNPSCVNPEHLFLGTHKENTNDMFKKGRNKECSHKKLTLEKEEECLRLYLSGITQREIAKIFNVHQRTVWKCLHKTLPISDFLGEQNNKSKLNENQVKEIRKKYSPRKFGCHRLARIYNVNKSTIQNIINRETWKHI